MTGRAIPVLAALVLMLAGCGPDERPATPAPPAVTAAVDPTLTPPGVVHYRSCGEARDAGDFPLKRGRDAGYRKALDRDGDGTACEAAP